MRRKQWRKLEEGCFIWLMRLALLIAVVGLGSILFTITSRGWAALSWEMVSQPPSAGFYLGGGGGILHALLGSLYLATGATLLALLIAVPVVLYINTYGRGSKTAEMVRLVLNILWGMPSIVFGVFILGLLLALGLRTSLLAGTIALALVIVPILARTFDEVVRLVPHELSETTLALGTTRLELSIMLLRQTMPGLLAGLFLAFERALGDGAAVLFTAGFTSSMPSSLFQPVASLPLVIFFQLATPFPEVQARAYAAALILTAIVLTFGMLGYFFLHHVGKHVIR
ncbi:PstA family ABC transporter permease [Candidatus Viridilinea mediisalina]|uniref:Phosphate ABC transporter permease n=1 Tax=Candidatus Viridilinea mediisalina TaxID=2024553 RepID=A0A2A6RNG3_9CHLR|nr:ABC transporter permease subunit [Candidatus Viridilinea mediisalina]PDW04456.1 phosphate ABC transporter permease [Candidatus Viridilinea mediisalina]